MKKQKRKAAAEAIAAEAAVPKKPFVWWPWAVVLAAIIAAFESSAGLSGAIALSLLLLGVALALLLAVHLLHARRWSAR